jgi:alkylhydroperoxidase family enzyme
MSQALSRLLAATRLAVLDGPGVTDSAVRRQVASAQPPPALAVLVGKIRNHADRITDDDLDVLRPHYTEDQLFEIIVAAALGAAEDRLKSALAAVEGA